MIPQKILAAIDLSSASGTVCESAFALAEAFGGQVDLVHALSLSELSESTLRAGNVFHEAQAVARQELQKLVESRLPASRVGKLIVREGDPVSVLRKVAEELRSDLLIVDTHHRGVERFVQGSVAESLVRDAPCSVLVLRQPRG
jgi:universal stress protein A